MKPPKPEQYKKEEQESWLRLEQASKHYHNPHSWTDEEIKKLKTFYGRVPKKMLQAEINHGWETIKQKACELGLKISKD